MKDAQGVLKEAFFLEVKVSDDLRVFLRRADKLAGLVQVEVKAGSSIKDTIEAIGVPHSEVSHARLHGSPVELSYSFTPHSLAQNGYRSGAELWVEGYGDQTRPKPLTPLKFAVDANLGRLATFLRMMGWDTAWKNHIPDPELVQLAVAEERILLTRDIGVLKRSSVKYGYFVREVQPKLQLAEVIKAYNIQKEARPWTRCSLCNGTFRELDREQARDRVPPEAYQFCKEFYECEHCGQVYWPGSHLDRMRSWIDPLRGLP